MWSENLVNYGDSSLIVIVPSSILSIRDADDRIEITADQKMICGFNLLYKTEIPMISHPSLNYFRSKLNKEDGRKWLSLGSSNTTVNVEEETSYPKRLKLSECDNWLSL